MDELEKYRKIYLKTRIPAELRYEGWNYIRTKLTEQDLPSPKRPWLPSWAFVSILLFIGLTSIAQAASPGQILYPVKLTTDNLVSKITNQPQLSVEKRADEVIKFSNNPNGPQLNQAASQYQKSLAEAKNEASNSGKNSQLKQSLNNQKQKLEQAMKDHPNSSSQLQPLIDQTEKTHGEVQGVHTQNHGNDDNTHQNNESLQDDQHHSSRDH